MPTSIKDAQFYVSTTSVSGGVSTTTYANQAVRTQVTLSDTVPRKLPADLFAAGTRRSGLSFIRKSSAVSMGNTVQGPNFTVSRGVPAINLWNADSLGTEPSLPNQDWELVLNKIRSDIRGEAVNLAMAVAEYKQTAKLFRALAGGVSSRGRSLGRALKSKNGVAKTWLGFQYGVKPAVSDILGSIDELKNACAQPKYVHGKETRRHVSRNVQKVTLNSTYHRHDAQLEFIKIRVDRMRYRAVYNPREAFNVIVAHGFTNPFALAYELIPFSFVIDWWINVGEMLASLDNLLLFDSLDAIKSWRIDSARYLTSPGYYRSGDPRTFLEPHSWTRIARQEERFPPSNESLIVVPRYKPSVSLTHILNGIALLRVTRGRFP